VETVDVLVVVPSEVVEVTEVSVLVVALKVMDEPDGTTTVSVLLRTQFTTE